MAGASILKGTAHKLGDHVNTDLIIPATHLVSNDPQELGKHLMEGHDPDFTDKIEPGDIIVAGENFGSGSSREHAPLAIKGGGISCVIAKSFARIFYRNAVNVGLPLIESPQAVDAISQAVVPSCAMTANWAPPRSATRACLPPIEALPGWSREIGPGGQAGRTAKWTGSPCCSVASEITRNQRSKSAAVYGYGMRSVRS